MSSCLMLSVFIGFHLLFFLICVERDSGLSHMLGKAPFPRDPLTADASQLNDQQWVEEW